MYIVCCSVVEKKTKNHTITKTKQKSPKNKKETKLNGRHIQKSEDNYVC